MWINNFHIFGDYAPFGGYKQSGVGREFGEAGLAEYTEVKRVHVNSFASHQANITMKVISDDPRVDWTRYQAPTNVVAGHGTLAGLPQAVVSLGCKKAMVLTDPGVLQAGLAQVVQNALCDFYVGTFDGIPADSDLVTVDQATALARELGADCIVSVGSGSVIDTAKAVCVALKNGGQANDYVGIYRLSEPQTPHIAIPTTSGTGSEVTNVAVIHNEELKRKVYIVDPYIIPNTAILDPRLTMTLPPGLTAATGMDAITHAVESLTSILAEPVCDGHALQALRLMCQFLPRAVANGEDEEARIQLSIAACLAGWAFTTAQVGLAHSLAHTVGTLHHVHHGTACGIVLPHVMRYNADFAAGKLALAADAPGRRHPGPERHGRGVGRRRRGRRPHREDQPSDATGRRRSSRGRSGRRCHARPGRHRHPVQRPSCARPYRRPPTVEDRLLRHCLWCRRGVVFHGWAR